MNWWYYKGQVTTPIDIPGKGPTVIRPRERFQAPLAAVAHLKRLGRVVPCKPPKEVLKTAQEAKEGTEAPKSASPKEKKLEERAPVPPTVVASKSEPKAEVVEKQEEKATVTEITEEEPKASELLEKEAPKEKEKESKKRRNKS